jgi:hypothetical protein
MKNTLLLSLCISAGICNLCGQTCQNKTVVSSVIDPTGNSANKGRTIEGPVCVEVFFNPLAGPVVLQTSETRAAGPDAGSVLLGGGGTGAGGKASKAAMAPGNPPISTEFTALVAGLKIDQDLVQSVAARYSQAVASQDQVIGDLKQLLNATVGIDPSTPALSSAVDRVAQSSLLTHLMDALSFQQSYQPTDKGAPPLLSDLQSLQADINDMPFRYSDGDRLQAGDTFSCTAANAKKISWTDWYGQCRDQYDSLKKNFQDAIAAAQQYATGSDNDKALKNKSAIVNFWKARLARFRPAWAFRRPRPGRRPHPEAGSPCGKPPGSAAASADIS